MASIIIRQPDLAENESDTRHFRCQTEHGWGLFEKVSETEDDDESDRKFEQLRPIGAPCPLLACVIVALVRL